MLSTTSARRAVAILAVMIAGVAFAQPAQAAPWSGTEYVVAVQHKAYGVINANNVIATCSGTKGAICDITVSRTVSRTVQTAFGLSTGFVAGKISLGTTTSETYSVTCGPWTLPTSTSKIHVYPKGTQVFYKITKNTYSAGKLTGSTTSGTLMAFKPDDNSYYCAYLR